MISRAVSVANQAQEDSSGTISRQGGDPPKVVLVATNTATGTNAAVMTQQLSEKSRLGGSATKAVDLCSLDPNKRICILLELDGSILRDMTQTKLEALQKLFSKSESVLWITKGASYHSTHPDLNLAGGLLRTLRAETGRRLILLDLDPASDSTTSADAIYKVYERCFEHGDWESEFVERGGVLLIPRHMEDDKSGINIASRIGNLSPETDVIPQPGRALTLEIEQFGLLDTLYFTDDRRIADELGEDYVEIEVKASSLNFRDIMMVSHSSRQCVWVLANAHYEGHGANRGHGSRLRVQWCGFQNRITRRYRRGWRQSDGHWGWNIFHVRPPAGWVHI
jgi:hypothetical protein